MGGDELPKLGISVRQLDQIYWADLSRNFKMLSTLACALLNQASTGAIAPAQTTVAIVPAYNATDERDNEHRADEAKMADQRVGELFAARKFKVASMETTAAAVSSLGLDFSDYEQRTKANLKKVAAKSGARLVTFVVVTDSTQRQSSGLFGGKVGRVGLTVWLYDAAEGKGIIDAQAVIGESKGGSGVLGEGQARRIAAVRIALDNLLTKDKGAFLAQFPTK